MYYFFKPGSFDLNEISENKKISTKVNLSCFDSTLNENLTYEVEIDSNSCLRDDNVVKLGSYKLIKTL